MEDGETAQHFECDVSRIVHSEMVEMANFVFRVLNHNKKCKEKGRKGVFASRAGRRTSRQADSRGEVPAGGAGPVRGHHRPSR